MTLLDNMNDSVSQNEDFGFDGVKYSTLNMLKSILSIMVPSMMTLLIAEMQWQINIIYVGRLNDENKLSAIGLCNQLFLSVPLAVTYGTTSVLETLVSQAYGSKQY